MCFGHATDLRPSNIRRLDGSGLCKKRLNERDRAYGESLRTQNLAKKKPVLVLAVMRGKGKEKKIDTP